MAASNLDPDLEALQRLLDSDFWNDETDAYNYVSPNLHTTIDLAAAGGQWQWKIALPSGASMSSSGRTLGSMAEAKADARANIRDRLLTSGPPAQQSVNLDG